EPFVLPIALQDAVEFIERRCIYFAACGPRRTVRGGHQIVAHRLKLVFEMSSRSNQAAARTPWAGGPSTLLRSAAWRDSVAPCLGRLCGHMRHTRRGSRRAQLSRACPPPKARR